MILLYRLFYSVVENKTLQVCNPHFMACVTARETSWLHMIWIHNILPPVMTDTVFTSVCFGQMPEPPFVVFTNIAIAPVGRGDSADLPLKIRKIFQPVITFTGDGAGVVPIIITLAVRREMDVPECRPAGSGFFIADEPLP